MIGQLVARDLLEEKPVVRLVGIECSDHVVAIQPGVVSIGVPAFGVGIARQIQPVASPPFSVAGRSEQAVDELLVRLRVAVGEQTPGLPPAWGAIPSGQSKPGGSA